MFSIRSVEAALVRRREWTLLRRLQKTHGQRLHEHARERAFGTRHTATRTSAAHAAQLAMAFLPPPTQLDMSEAEAIFDLIDKSHLSLGAGEIQDGRLDEQDCRGLARAMELDEDRFWRLLKRHGEQEGDGRVTFAEWIAAIADREEDPIAAMKAKRAAAREQANGAGASGDPAGGKGAAADCSA